jgi:hypothetical protein
MPLARISGLRLRKSAFYLMATRLFGLAIMAMAHSQAAAEYCWMVGCEGAIAYVFIPQSQLLEEGGEKGPVLRLNAATFPLDTSNRLLTRSGLPSVDEVVTLNIIAYLLSHEQLAQRDVINETKRNWYTLNVAEHSATLYAYNFASFGMVMRRGARVRILGYTGDAMFGPSNLFALVRVESD